MDQDEVRRKRREKLLARQGSKEGATVAGGSDGPST